ncbi:MAG: TolC family protein [Armatimonadota bacterium]
MVKEITMLIRVLICLALVSSSAGAITIDEAVNIALARNVTVREEQRDVEAAEAALRRARAEGAPTVDAEATYTTYTDVPSAEVAPGEQVDIISPNNLVVTATARQALYTGGRVPAEIDRAEAQLAAAQSALLTTETEIAFQARRAYYNVLLALGLVRATEDQLAAARSQLATATARFEIGVVARFDVLRAETQVSEAEQNLREAENQVRQAEIALNRLLNLSLESTHEYVDPGQAPFPTEELPTLVEQARAERSEIRTAAARIAAAEAEVQIVRSGGRPTIGVFAGYQAVANEDVIQTSSWIFGVEATVTLFDFGRTRADVSRTQALAERARIGLEDVASGVEQDVRDAYLDLATALENIRTAQARLAQAQEAYDVAVVRYEAGVGTATELADALAALSTASTNLQNAVFNYNIAYAALQRALGRVV